MAIRVLACTNPAALSEKAHGALIAAAKGLAMTAVDLLADPSLLSEAKAEFDAGSGRSQSFKIFDDGTWTGGAW